MVFVLPMASTRLITSEIERLRPFPPVLDGVSGSGDAVAGDAVLVAGSGALD